MDSKREAYLREVADDYGVSFEFVCYLAELLGPNEDHDALITILEDMSAEELDKYSD